MYSALRLSMRAFVFRSLISCIRLAILRETKKEWPNYKDLKNISEQEQNFHACVVWATKPRVGGGRAKRVFLGNI